MHPHLNEVIQRFHQQTPLRTGSLIVTIFGDSIAPRGGEVWLGSLIDALNPVRVSHRLVRTAVYRLIQDNILANEQVGRRSYYRLTDSGQADFEVATKRIYGDPQPQWDGQWLLVLASAIDQPHRQRVKAAMLQLGMAAIAGDVYGHPCKDLADATTSLSSYDFADQLLFSKGPLSAADGDAAKALVLNNWPIENLGQAYTDMVNQFTPFVEDPAASQLAPQDAFLVRTFLIHQYRKVVLRVPVMPDVMLPLSFLGARV